MNRLTESGGCSRVWCKLKTFGTLGAVFGLALLATLVQAASYQIGEQVEVEWRFEWQPAKVIRIAPNGWITVELADSSFRITPTLPPNKVRHKSSPPASRFGADARKKRTWTDRTGRFHIEATLLDVKDGKVTLKRTDGRTVTLPKERLSQADQDFLDEAEKAANEANPFEPAEPMASSTGSANSVLTPPPPASGDWSQARTIMPGQPVSDWTWTPDAQATPVPLKTQPLPLRGTGGNFFDQPRGVVLSPSTGRAVIGHLDSRPDREAAARFEYCDLAKGRLLNCQTVSLASIPLDFSPDGQQFVARAEGHMPGSKNRLDIWTLGDQNIEHVIGWTPAKSQKQFEQDIVFAHWTDNDHLIAVTTKGKLTLWQTDPLRAIYTISVHPNSRPAVSPGGKYLAVMSSGGLEFYRAQDGKLVGRLTTDSVRSSSLCFRPDGTQLAVLCPRLLMVWDLTTGKLLREIAVSSVPYLNTINWITDNNVLLDGKRLIDIEKRIVLWEYSYEDPRSAEAVASLEGSLWFVATNRLNHSQWLVPCKLPHDDAVAVATKLDPESLLAVKPGVSVALEVRVPATKEQSETIRQELTKKLEKNQVKVASGQPIQLIARVVEGETKEIHYRSFGTPLWGGGDKIRYKEHRCELVFVVDGQTAWQAVNVASPPPILRLRRGQTAEQAVKEATQPNLNFFLETKIPAYVVRPTGRTAYGQSKLTTKGPVRVLPRGKRPVRPTKKKPKVLGV